MLYYLAGLACLPSSSSSSCGLSYDGRCRSYERARLAHWNHLSLFVLSSLLGKRVFAQRAIYFACVNFFYIFYWRPIIPGSAGPLFMKLLPNSRYLIIDYWSDFLFPIAQGTLPWQPILKAKSVRLAYSPLFIAAAFQNGLEYRNADERFNSGGRWSRYGSVDVVYYTRLRQCVLASVGVYTLVSLIVVIRRLRYMRQLASVWNCVDALVVLLTWLSVALFVVVMVHDDKLKVQSTHSASLYAQSATCHDVWRCVNALLLMLLLIIVRILIYCSDSPL